MITGVPAVSCGGDTIEVMASGNFNMYDFTLGGTLVQSSADSTYDFIADSTTTLVVNSMGICNYSDTLNINVSPAPDPMLTGPTTPLCDGDSTVLAVGNGFTNVVWSTGTIAQNIQVLSSGTYSVEVTDVNGCMAMDSIAVNFLPPLNPVVTYSPQPPYCQGDTA